MQCSAGFLLMIARANMKDFGSLTEIFSIQTTNFESTHTRTPRRSDPLEIIWEVQGGFTRRAHAPSKGRINQYTQDYGFEF